MSDNKNTNRRVLEGPTNKEPQKPDIPTTQTGKSTRVRKAPRNTENSAIPVTRWQRILPFLALVLPFVSMLFPLPSGMIPAGVGALLGLVIIIRNNDDPQRRWAAIAGMVIGVILIPLYLLLAFRGVTSIIFPR